MSDKETFEVMRSDYEALAELMPNTWEDLLDLFDLRDDLSAMQNVRYALTTLRNQAQAVVNGLDQLIESLDQDRGSIYEGDEGERPRVVEVLIDPAEAAANSDDWQGEEVEDDYEKYARPFDPGYMPVDDYIPELDRDF